MAIPQGPQADERPCLDGRGDAGSERQAQGDLRRPKEVEPRGGGQKEGPARSGYLAHLFSCGSRFEWSGYLASGDPWHQPYAYVVEVGRPFWISDDGLLCIVERGRSLPLESTPEGLVTSAKAGFLGMKVVAQNEYRSKVRDLIIRSRPRDRRKRIEWEQAQKKGQQA